MFKCNTCIVIIKQVYIQVHVSIGDELKLTMFFNRDNLDVV